MLHELENNEAVLMMYLAGELPDADRSEVEQQLARDSGMRATLEALKRLNEGMTGVLTHADGVALPAVTENARQAMATRRVSRLMVKHQLEMREDSEADGAVERKAWFMRMPRWVYPSTAAAVLLVAWVAYWGFTNAGTAGMQRAGNERMRFQRDYGDEGGGGGDFRPSIVPEDDAVARAQALADSAADVLPVASPYLRTVDESDRQLMVFSAGAYDVSSIFSPEADPIP